MSLSYEDKVANSAPSISTPTVLIYLIRKYLNALTVSSVLKNIKNTYWSLAAASKLLKTSQSLYDYLGHRIHKC